MGERGALVRSEVEHAHARAGTCQDTLPDYTEEIGFSGTFWDFPGRVLAEGVADLLRLMFSQFES